MPIAPPPRLRELLSSTRFRLVAALVGFLLAASFITRLVLLVASQSPIAPGSLVRTLLVGEIFDLTAALWLAAPLVLYLFLLPERWFASRFHRAVVFLWTFATMFGVLFLVLVEVFFFDEFNGRFNFVAVDYLMFPTEVVTNVWESYHTGLWLGLFAILSLAGTFFLWPRQLLPAWKRPLAWRQRVRPVAAFALVLAALTVAVSPNLAKISDDRELNEIAGNGYYSFWMALLGRDAPYAGWYASASDAELTERLPALLAEPAVLPRPPVRPAAAHLDWSAREIQNPGPERRWNVVVVLEESLGSEFVGALKPNALEKLGIDTFTPRFDALAREGTLLTHAFSTGNRTIRAIEATTTSLPPLPGISIVRREASRDLFTLPAVLRERGYQTLFVYGGRALFDNMGSYLLANGVDRVVDQGDFPKDSFHTAWGVSDEAIFDRALTEMDGLEASGKPFYSLVLSVSNHRPFLFPEGRITPEPKYRRRGNAVRYADYALGRFIEQARGHDFFDHTLFVMMGDHGARVYGAAEIPLASYEVPILLFAPGLVPAGARVDTVASSLDVPPTILGLLGFDYASKMFGHDVLRIDPAAGRALMTHNSDIALLRGDRLAVLGLRESTTVYRYDATSDALTKLDPPDEAGRALLRDAITYYASADRLYRAGAYRFESALPGSSAGMAQARKE